MGLDSLRDSNKNGKMDKLLKAASKTSMGKTKSFSDDDVFVPHKDAAGNGSAIIRFLPGLKKEDEPYYVERFSHGFQNPKNKKWFIENCPTTLGNECPVCAKNSELWNSGSEANKKIASKRARKTSYYANCLVISDKANPENEGRIMKFRFGKKILEKILGKAQPEFEDQEAVDVFDAKTGANFRLSVRKVEGWPNYDKSEFAEPTSLSKADLARLEKDQFELLGYTAPSEFLEYDVLAKKLSDVIGGDEGIPSRTQETPEEEPEEEEVPEEEEETSDGGNEAEPETEGDDMDYFANLAKNL